VAALVRKLPVIQPAPIDPVAAQLQPRDQPQQRRLEAPLAGAQRHLGAELCTAEACVKLRRSDRPVADMAQACGFLTLPHCHAQFKQGMREKPRAHRGRA
jgi:transcriptional regulator GlxA family with amidase domain